MIDLYYWTTPNGHKITIFLEETGLQYRIVPVNLETGEQFKPDFLAISPNHHIPVIIDHKPTDSEQPLTMIESGAILLYLAQKTGKLLPREVHAREQAMQWLFWQMSTLGPMASQMFFFRLMAKEKIPYALDHYMEQVRQCFAIMDKRLADNDFLGGDYSIADITCYPWVANYAYYKQDINELPKLKRWLNAIKARPAVERAYAKAKEINPKVK